MGGSILLGICSFVFGGLGIRMLFFSMTTLGHQHDDLLVMQLVVPSNVFAYGASDYLP